MKLNIWTKELQKITLTNLKPRKYMLDWDFQRRMAYIKKELYWQDIKEDDVEVIEIANEKSHWISSTAR